MKLLLVILLAHLIVADKPDDGCDLGWFRYKNYKCVRILESAATFDESQQYCETAFGATLLKIDTDRERHFWSFHLMRFNNLKDNVWLDRQQNKSFVKEEDKMKSGNVCLVMKSETGNGSGSVGDIIEQSCDELGATVCQIKTNKELAYKTKAVEYNINEDVVPNIALNYSNGTQSHFFSGVYYAIVSKYENTMLDNKVLANGQCQLGKVRGKNCANNLYKDMDMIDKTDNYFMFTAGPDNHFQIRRFDSEKILVYQPEKYLANFHCFEDGLTLDGKELCDDALYEYGAESHWKIDPYKNTGYFIIRSKAKDLVLGAVTNSTDIATPFGLYKVDIKSQSIDDRLLFKVEPLNYTLDVHIVGIDFDDGLDRIVEKSKKQLSIVDTAVIKNNSPATLTHEVQSTKEFTETFSTSWGTSQEFMESFMSRDELGTSVSDTSSRSKSFTDTASQSISTQLSNSISSSSSQSSESSSGHSFGAGVSASANIGNSMLGASVGASANYGYNTGSSSSSSSSQSRESSQTQSQSQDTSRSNTQGEEQSTSQTKNVNQAKEKTNQQHKTSDQRNEQSGTKSRTYSIYKTVSLPPFSAVKISSYANWIDDMTIKFNMTLKLQARAFRRQTNGEATNLWRTLDKSVVEHLMRVHKFPGQAVESKGFDSVLGRVTGYMTASVGLESVFVSKEEPLNK